MAVDMRTQALVHCARAGHVSERHGELGQENEAEQEMCVFGEIPELARDPLELHPNLLSLTELEAREHPHELPDDERRNRRQDALADGLHLLHPGSPFIDA